MQQTVEIVIRNRSYIIKVDDELTFEEMLIETRLVSQNEIGRKKINVVSKKRYAQMHMKLKDLVIVNNDIVQVLENDEKAI